MRVLDEDPPETIHLYVVPERALPHPPQSRSFLSAAATLLCLLIIVGISLVSATTADHALALTLTVPGFHLTPVSKTVRTTVIATGKGHVPATSATGTITFYNGALSTQLIPVDTQLTGADGVRVLTDEPARIPPAAQTVPPTYGQTTVRAHSLVPGVSGNIRAGDINIACCVTSVIAQNPSPFSGGSNARTFSYLRQQDVIRTTATLAPELQKRVLALLPAPYAQPSCFIRTHSSPGVGKETWHGELTVVETCTADSYHVASIAQALTAYSQRLGAGTLTQRQIVVVGVSQHQGVRITLYVIAWWHPLVARRFPGVGK